MTWAVSQELPGSNNLPHVQTEALEGMAPPGALRGGSWASAYSPGTRTLHWANGGVTVFKSYDQDLLAFEGAKVAGVWLDEEPTKKEIYTSCLMRLTDLSGHWWMTFTPVLSLQGKSWVRDDLWEQREKLSDMVTFVQASIFDNPHIPHGEVRKILAGMTDEERAVRAEGSFATLSGRVITEYDPKVHDIDPLLPGEEDRVVLVIDPGYQNPTAGLWCAVSPEGVGRLFMEHYERKMTPAQHMAIFHAQWMAIGRPPVVLTYMDPASWNPRGTDTGHRLPSAVYEYRQAAEQMGATWFQPLKASNADTSCLKLKRAFAQKRLFVCRHLKWFKWEVERLVYMREAGGRRGQEHNMPEKPVDKDNHSTDCARYLLNAGLIPIEEFVSEPYDPLKEYWAKARASMQPVGAKEEWLA
jgi:phage terminase large subunit-like protein